MIWDANTMATKKRLHTWDTTVLISVLVLASVTSSASWVVAKSTTDPIQICSEIVYQGFTGVSKIAKIESRTLSKQEAENLEGLLQKSEFFSLPAAISSPKFDGCCDRGFPDFRITVDANSKRHTVTINTQNVARPQELMPLLRWLEARAEHPGGAQGRSTNEKCPE